MLPTFVIEAPTLSCFWATVCKTVRLMLSDRCLSACLSVTLVYCGQTVGRIKMKLGRQIGLGPGHIVLDGDPAHPPLNGHSLPQFSARVCFDQMSAWIKMLLGMEVCLGPSDFVLDGVPAFPPQKGRRPTIFGPCLLWPNGWMDQDATW